MINHPTGAPLASVADGSRRAVVGTRDSDRGRGAIFVTYNGLLDPLGPSQILPYVERLHRRWPIGIVSFERRDRLADHAALTAMNKRLEDQRIYWRWLRYHKWPSLLATTWDLLVGAAALRTAARRMGAGLIHARGYLPAAIAGRARTGLPLLFDIRGLQPEEYVDGGVWREGELKHRLAKRAERRFFREASGAVVLTSAIRPYVEQRFLEHGRHPPLEVIPCCVDLERFRFDPSARTRIRAVLGVADATVLFVYSGSIGTWYQPAEMAEFVARFKHEAAHSVHLLWIVNNAPEAATAASMAAGLRTTEFSVRQAPPAEVPAYLSASDAALALIRPCFSKRSSSPTKYAECLASGLPLVISRDVGDGHVLEARGVAVALPFPPTPADFAESARRLRALLSRPRDSFRALAEELFDIDSVALPAYERLYEGFLG